MSKERCGHPMMDRVAGVMSECGRLKGHKGKVNGSAQHMSVAAVQRRAERNTQRLTGESVCTSKGCDAVAPKGSMQCKECARAYMAAYYARPEVKARNAIRNAAHYATPEGKAYRAAYQVAYINTTSGSRVHRKADRLRRERRRNARYEDLTKAEILERDNYRCYVCGDSLTFDTAEVEHVIALTNFERIAKEYDGEFSSGLRAACRDCNRGQGGKFDQSPASFILNRWQAGLPIVQALTVNCAEICPLFALAA